MCGPNVSNFQTLSIQFSPQKKKEENDAGHFPFGRDYFFESISALNRMFSLQQMCRGVCGLSGIDVSK